MASATLNLNVLQKRMLTKSEAAEHCGRSARRFEIECPVQSVRFANGEGRLTNMKENRNLVGSGGGTRTPDTRIMISRVHHFRP